MIEICAKDKCTGCYACANICPKQCISLTEDELGAVHPIIDQNKCIDCKLCEKTCPNNVDLNFNYPLLCNAAWITDQEKRKICASGGIGTTMSEYVIQNGGVVFGSRYDADMTPIITYTDNLDGLQHFKGSRYVQSLVGNETFKNVRKFLLEGRFVLYIGTPCQIAGLKSFLKKDYDNLITVDLICHGVCPTKYLKNDIAFLSEKFGFKDVSDIRFRGNDGNNYKMTLWDKNNKRIFPRDNFFQKILHTDNTKQYYISGFLTGTTLRENCFSCDYARPDRISDITIGDFIGLGRKIPFNESARNVSSVTLNTEKGLDFYRQVSKSHPELRNIKRDYQERLEYKPSLLQPSIRPNTTEQFRDLYKSEGYNVAIQKTMKKYLRDAQIKRYVRLITSTLPKKILFTLFGKDRVMNLKNKVSH